MNGMVERRMRKAIFTVGSIWYSAWVDAGQPNLNNLLKRKPSADLLEEMNNLDVLYKNHEHKGRVCD
jgi:hypothetical protein